MISWSTKKLISGVLSFYCWTLATFAVVLSTELKDFDSTVTALMVSIHTVLAGFTTFYTGFCLCHVDLMDSEQYPFMYSFLVCMIGLSVPIGYGIVVLLVILIQKHFHSMSLLSEIYIVFTCGSWAIGAVGLTIYIVTTKVVNALKEREVKLKKSTFEKNIESLKELMQNSSADFKLFAQTFKNVLDPNSLLSKLELWYLTQFTSTIPSNNPDPESPNRSTFRRLNVSLRDEGSNNEIPEQCSICQVEFDRRPQNNEPDYSMHAPIPAENHHTDLPVPDPIIEITAEELPALIMPVCRHVFHVECITRWLELSLFCPMCKTNVRSNLVTHFEQSTETGVQRQTENAGILSAQQLRSVTRVV